jgi:hypothetical protein
VLCVLSELQSLTHERRASSRAITVVGRRKDGFERRYDRSVELRSYCLGETHAGNAARQSLTIRPV